MINIYIYIYIYIYILHYYSDYIHCRPTHGNAPYSVYRSYRIHSVGYCTMDSVKCGDLKVFFFTKNDIKYKIIFILF